MLFTSSNGVEIFWDTFRHSLEKDVRCLAGLKFAVIGKGTKEALENCGIHADFIPARYSSKDMAEEWVPTLKPEDRVLMLRAQEASGELNQALDQAGIPYTDAAIYHTASDDRKKEELNRILSQVDYVTFASASAVKAFSSMLEEEQKECSAKIVCIGPVTEKAALKERLKVYRSAVEYTAEGIRDVLLYDTRQGESRRNG